MSTAMIEAHTYIDGHKIAYLEQGSGSPVILLHGIPTNSRMWRAIIPPLLRLSIFIVMFMWTLDKIVRPDHAASVFENYYSVGVLSHAVTLTTGALEMVLLVAFILGVARRWPTGRSLFCMGFRLSPHTSTTSPPSRGRTFSSSPRGRCWRRVSACICSAILTRWALSDGQGASWSVNDKHDENNEP